MYYHDILLYVQCSELAQLCSSLFMIRKSLKNEVEEDGVVLDQVSMESD